MRDEGLSQAISAVGGVSELARRIGISQPSISTWSRVPAERALTVETATGVSRQRLRPDLYANEAISPSAASRARCDAALARAEEYSLLSMLLSRAPSSD